MKPRIKLSPMSSPTAWLWQCGVIGAGRTPLEAFRSWERQIAVRPDLARFA